MDKERILLELKSSIEVITGLEKSVDEGLLDYAYIYGYTFKTLKDILEMIESED